MKMKENWIVKNIAGDFYGLAEKFGISPITARLLVNRNLRDVDGIEAFFHSKDRSLRDASLMKDMVKGTGILAEKIKQKKKIRIIGDYDADGVCSTFILYDYFKRSGADISYEIPHRIYDGYGINKEIIEKAKQEGIDTILTCDNGISAYDEVEYAKSLGLSVIITDHHDIPLTKPLPRADAVIDPKREDCAYGFSKLCGAGVAYQFIRYFNENLAAFKMKEKELEEKYLGFVALATICDVMELVEENRIIVKKGIDIIKNTENIGMRALLRVSGIEEKDNIGVYHCGFILGPMINASGRLESAKLALELFLETNIDAAVERAEELAVINEERKMMTEEGVDFACKIADSPEYKDDKVLVILIPDLHESIAGIVAGKVKERYYKPTLIFTKAKRGIKGSGRSIDEYNLFEEISRCSDLFLKFGGHPTAAGFSMLGESEEEQFQNLLALRRRLNRQAVLTEEDLTPKVKIDMMLPLTYVSEGLAEELEKLAPFGMGNPMPCFGRKEVRVYQYKIFGKNQNVVKMELTDGECCTTTEAIWFGEGEVFKEFIDNNPEKKMDIVFTPEINVYKDKRNVQIKIMNFR